MNYPIWNLPASGLLIALVATVHVFISHFAVGGGLFLVWTERKARREEDPGLLDYVKRLSRFFILLTLVLGAMTGVGIWFTIALVHPQATSSLINTFVWGWAIEWTFFFTEIAAAMIYYYGWTRMSPRNHMRVGWIYFWAAWLSLVVINGILTYMLTPGDWVDTRGFWDGILNPTYLPSLATRTLVAVGIAGMFALFAASKLDDRELKRKIARYASGWVLPSAAALPIALFWYLNAVRVDGVPVGTILGSGGEGGPAAIRNALTLSSETGYPMAQYGVLVTVAASVLIFATTAFIAVARSRAYGRPVTGTILILGLLAMGGGEWVREDLRKPYVIGQYMFVHGARLSSPPKVPNPPEGIEDRFTLEAIDRSGLLEASLWDRTPEPFSAGEGALALLDPAERVEAESAAGREVFKILCSSCHTVDGYNAIRPLVTGQSAGALENSIARLARFEDHAGETLPWNRWWELAAELETWRNRRMPPFVGSDRERRALAVYLARLGGASTDSLVPPVAAGPDGRQTFEDYCALCHAADSDWPMPDLIRGSSADDLYDLIGVLPELNDAMPPFEGTDEERRALAGYLETLGR
jgi:mono/diheme cytochrome c family protein